MTNYYYDTVPGLKSIGSAEMSDGDYQFYIIDVFTDGESIYIGVDSGCSCPTPFEDYNSLEDYDKYANPHDAIAVVDEYITNAEYGREDLMNIKDRLIMWRKDRMI